MDADTSRADDLSVEVKELAVLSTKYPNLKPSEYILAHGSESLLNFFKKKQEHNPHIEKFGVENLVDRSVSDVTCDGTVAAGSAARSLSSIRLPTYRCFSPYQVTKDFQRTLCKSRHVH